jgi:hypothetical protein
METFVRGGSLDAIVDANMKVDRCLRAGEEDPRRVQAGDDQGRLSGF